MERFGLCRGTIVRRRWNLLPRSVSLFGRPNIHSLPSRIKGGLYHYYFFSQVFFVYNDFDRSIWTFTGRGDKPYLVAKNPGDFVTFEVLVGLMRRVRITYLKSKTFGLGTVLCWLDDERSKGKKISGWWDKDKL